jgi:hypothetical protein
MQCTKVTVAAKSVQRRRIGRSTVHRSQSPRQRLVEPVDIAQACLPVILLQDVGDQRDALLDREGRVAFLYPQFVLALKRAHDLEMSSQVIYAWYIVLAVYSVLVRFAGWLWINLTQNIYSLVVLAFVFVFIFVVGIVSAWRC